MKQNVGYILLALLVIILLIALSFGMGWVSVGYKNTVGVADASADRNIYKNNKSYVEGMISDLAKYKYEITTEKNAVARKAIAELIISKYANFDMDNIQDITLLRFLQDVKSGKYSNLEEK